MEQFSRAIFRKITLTVLIGFLITTRTSVRMTVLCGREFPAGNALTKICDFPFYGSILDLLRSIHRGKHGFLFQTRKLLHIIADALRGILFRAVHRIEIRDKFTRSDCIHLIQHRARTNLFDL